MEICRFSTYASLVAQWENQVVWLTVQYLTLKKKKTTDQHQEKSIEKLSASEQQNLCCVLAGEQHFLSLCRFEYKMSPLHKKLKFSGKV